MSPTEVESLFAIRLSTIRVLRGRVYHCAIEPREIYTARRHVQSFDNTDYVYLLENMFHQTRVVHLAPEPDNEMFPFVRLFWRVR